MLFFIKNTGNQLKAKIQEMENVKLENQKEFNSLTAYKEEVDLLLQKNLQAVNNAIDFVDQKINFIGKYVL